MLDQKTQERSAAAPVRPANRWLIATIAVLAVAVIGLAIWALAERNQAEDLSADLTVAESQIIDLETQATDLEAQLAVSSDVVVVGGGPLTARQEEMVTFVTGPWTDAWMAADGEAVASLFTPFGVQYDFEGDEVLTIADGTIESFGSSWPGLRVMGAMLVHGDRIATVVEAEGLEVGAIIDFTESGELLVESVAMYDSVLGPNR